MSGQITLYEAADQYIAVLDHIDPETGELPPEFGDVHALVTSKAAACAAYVLNTEAHAVMVSEASEKLADKADAMRRRAEHLREYLKVHMQRVGITEIAAADRTFKIQLQRERDSHVEIFDPAQVPDAFMRYPEAPPPTPNKKLIGTELKRDHEIPGARLVKTDRLVIS